MIIPVLCFTCGNVGVGIAAGVFRLLAEELRRKVCAENDVLPENLAVDFSSEVDYDAILNECGIPRQNACCRTTLMTTIELAHELTNGQRDQAVYKTTEDIIGLDRRPTRPIQPTRRPPGTLGGPGPDTTDTTDNIVNVDAEGELGEAQDELGEPQDEAGV